MNDMSVTSPPAGIGQSGQVELSAADSESSAVQLISFAIGDEQYGVDIMAVREIKGWTEITPLPGQSEYVRGVLNLRGAIVPIVDLRCRFGQGLTQASPLHICIIVQIGEKPIGLLADRVLDIVSLDSSEIKPEPRVTQSQRVSFLSGLVTTDSGMIALIDLPNLLAEHLAEDKKTEAGVASASAAA
jgi:purine-binding chemotaxis protein CheW